MRPSEILQHAHGGSARFVEATLALERLLATIVSGRVVAGRSHGLLIPTEDREEIAFEVKLRVLERAPLAEAASGDEPSLSYLRRMVANRFIDLQRQRRPYLEPQADEDGIPHPPEIAVASGVEQLIDEKRSARLIEQVFGEHLARKRSHHRETEAAWARLRALIGGTETMDSLIDDELGPDAGDLARRRARDRIFTQSKRLRTGMAQAARAMYEEGRLHEEDLRVAEFALQRLLRCQRSEPAHVGRLRGRA